MVVLGILLKHLYREFYLACRIAYPFHDELAVVPNLIVFLMLCSHVVQEFFLFGKVLPKGEQSLRSVEPVWSSD